jgi:hypothetical protein
VAALCAVPPVAFTGQLMERGLDPPHAIVTSMAMMKIEAAGSQAGTMTPRASYRSRPIEFWHSLPALARVGRVGVT